MDTGIIFVVILLVGILIRLSLRRHTIYEYERGLLYNRGRFRRVLEPGTYWFLRASHTLKKVDVRKKFVSIDGQDVLSADNVSIKVSLVAGYRIADPDLAINHTEHYWAALYLLLQLSARDIIGSVPIEELLAQREEIERRLFEASVEEAAKLGLELLRAGIKDVMFPGDLKKVFAQVINARKEGQAALERARGESAALRNLANAAKMLEKNPALMQLRLLQVLGEQSGNTVILTSKLDEALPLRIIEKDEG